ncbi:DUF4145 domain-containing protein [Salinibacterium hongtaonis]|uniref:DUF4145 domain-containing protein n=1 Tax=Homoserinimonas hongtaonis TaxID=2079791 RepID=UPI000D3A8DF0|nr:DUF4145 domain-containing protein [Salinibacterium hongtaonis]AWB88752.1 hypothetical protein C2138_03590 [Salinibacterium hongtaonis]
MGAERRHLDADGFLASPPMRGTVPYTADMSSVVAVWGDDDRFACPYDACRAFSYHIRQDLKITAQVARMQTTVELRDESHIFSVSGTNIVAASSGVSGPKWTATLCPSCERMAVWRDSELIFPRTTVGVPAPHPDMPDAARQLYREAAAVLAGSRRAAAALARAALESLLKEVDLEPSQRRDLNTRVGELRGRINDGLWKVLTALRVVGNDALHSDDDDLITVYLSDEDGELAETFFGAINELVEELITRPKRSDELYALIPETKREAAERAGKKRD